MKAKLLLTAAVLAALGGCEGFGDDDRLITDSAGAGGKTTQPGAGGKPDVKNDAGDAGNTTDTGGTDGSGSTSDTGGTGGAGGGGTTSVFGGPSPDLPNVAPLGSGAFSTAEITSILDVINPLEGTSYYSDLIPTIPTGGSATYNGIMRISQTDFVADEQSGRFTMNADFTSGTLSGSASDFVFVDLSSGSPSVVVDMTGTLAINNGLISGTDYTAGIVGQLDNTGGGFPQDISIGISGGFGQNASQDVVHGGGSGQVQQFGLSLPARASLVGVAE